MLRIATLSLIDNRALEDFKERALRALPDRIKLYWEQATKFVVEIKGVLKEMESQWESDDARA